MPAGLLVIARCGAGSALILCFFGTSTKSRHVYCWKNRGDSFTKLGGPGIRLGRVLLMVSIQTRFMEDFILIDI